MRIFIGSTSFLLNGNKNWEYLESANNIIFSKYAGVYETLNNNYKCEVDILVIFLPDILNYYNSNIKSQKNEERILTDIISLIKRRVNSNKNNLIISVSEYLYKNSISDAKFSRSTIEIKINFLRKLYSISKNYSNLFILNMDEVFSYHGYNNCFEMRNYYLSRCRLSYLGIEILSKNIKKIINRIYSTNKKVLILDCDNTLWDGVLGEDGDSKIKIGNEGIGLIYYDFQRAIKKIKDKGVLLTVVSKNNESDVINIFKKKNFMPLQYEDITLFKVNWDSKYKNIIEISKELDLGINSFVFWDDNPIERERIRFELKEVDVIDPSSDPSNWSLQLLEYDGFSKFRDLKDDSKKTQLYKLRDSFKKNKSAYGDEIEYLKSIKIKPNIVKINKITMGRAIELSQKTNQFNLRTVRYIEKNIEKFLKNKKHVIFLISLKDNYGDHGIIGLIHLKNIEKDSLFIYNFLLSCRILGRYLEFWILNKIKQITKSLNKKFIIAEYIDNKKNLVAKKFILDSGFKKNNKKKNIYLFDIRNKIPKIEIYE
jgi:FkbH-like protein